jgi:hypothetical protein
MMLREPNDDKKIMVKCLKQLVNLTRTFCLLKLVVMAVLNDIDSLAIRMFSTRQYPFKVVAFVKVNYANGAKILSFVVDKNRDLNEFCRRMISPVHRLESHKITTLNLLWIAFHEKVKGDKTLSMEVNKNYLISWSPKRSFYNKSTVAAAKKSSVFKRL